MSTRTRAWILVAFGAAGICFSGPLTAALAIPTLSIAFWRNAFGALATAPVVAVRDREQLRGLDAAARRHTVLAAVLLAAHFALWLPSLRMTTVALATALAATTPIWTVLLLALRGRRPTRSVLVGVALAMAGILAITGFDATSSLRALAGDLLALAGGATYAGYALAGEQVRRTTSTPVYTALAYSLCAAILAALCLLTRQPFGGWPARQWLGLGLLTLTAQLIGHSGLNHAMPVLGSTVLSLVVLLEVPGAALIAWAWLGQVPPLAVLPGAVLVLAGLAVVARDRRPV